MRISKFKQNLLKMLREVENGNDNEVDELLNAYESQQNEIECLTHNIEVYKQREQIGIRRLEKVVRYLQIQELTDEQINHILRLEEENEYMKFSKAISTVMSPKSFVEKEEEYIILDQNNYICSEVNSLGLAKEFVDNSLQKDSSNTFTIYKKIKTGKAKVNVETEWEE